ncbi:SagB/ThcOx family dehydrogenase [Pseudomonas sessilinigenes]|uniref:SagB/ThcOx family dehydrogenase n=1 Tax=Pseudomonas sessilinigenes TaxID=658629 RepID=A0ABX8MFI3_9PSED|nr:SagB/ThcOx family dehydrogenase [Pseudomonas sessilinigenes]AZC24844.1 hypothetical protein C4K39_3170 [Pseudomonas sessilinigenes]QXH37895.1 SagB/ThcOx family dehydrogenase [Pseudomonas sessilinigenes]
METNEIKKWLSSDIFIFFKQGKPYLWDFRNHRQFEISTEDFSRLSEFAEGSKIKQDKVDQAITEAGILTDGPSNEEEWGWDFLARIYHIGTSHPNAPSPYEPSQHIEYAKSYLDFCQSIHASSPQVLIKKGGTKNLLPTPNYQELINASLWHTLVKRQTCRDFYDETISIESLSTILGGTLGAVDRGHYDSPVGVQRFGYRRTSPSAGGLQATEGYVWVRKVKDITPGIYHYVNDEHYLEEISPLPIDPLSTLLCNQHWCDDLAFAIFFVAKFDVMWWKYPHSRAYRPMLMDIGHLSQTFQLLATALGLQTWLTGYFHDKEINNLLKLTEPKEQVIFVVGAGHGSGSGYDRTVRRLLDENS